MPIDIAKNGLPMWHAMALRGSGHPGFPIPFPNIATSFSLTLKFSASPRPLLQLHLQELPSLDSKTGFTHFFLITDFPAVNSHVLSRW